MLKKKKNLLFASSLAGLIIGATSLSVALSSCTTTNTSDSTDVQYNYKIDWDDQEQVKRLIVDNNGLVYADKTKTTVIAVSPKAMLNTITIPSIVKNISGYVKVTTNSKGVKVYQSVGAFQDMVSLNSVVLETGSQLKSISGSAFSGCTTLKSISGLTNSLDYIGANAFLNCVSLTSIDTSNVLKVDNYAFSGCTGLESVDLSKAIAIGDYSFQNCSNLTSIGSLEKVTSVGKYAFSRATKSGSNISLKFNNLQIVSHSAFEATKGINKIDFSNNTLLTTIVDNAFLSSSVTEADFTGCTNLSNISERAFEGCVNLTNVYLPSNDVTNLTSLGWNAFSRCPNIESIAPKGTKSGFVATNKLTTIGANCFANSSITTMDLTEFNVSSSTTPFGSVTSLAFIPNLSSITLPNNIASLNACLFYGTGVNSTTGFSLTLPSSIKSIITSESLIITNPNSGKKETIRNATPFTNSGISFIDMSKITSYQSNNTTSIPNYLFNGASKLTSVILKPETTEIEQCAFQNTTALTSITYPASSEAETVAETTSGFTASSDLTTIGTDAFKGAFSAESNATIDLSEMSSGTTAPVAFNNSNVVDLKLPLNITTIEPNSFDDMTKLSSVNFEQLTELTTINKQNFNNTQLATINLSNVKNAATLFTGTGDLFSNLPTKCIVSLPNTMGNFSGVFIGIGNQPVTFSYPNGLSLQNPNLFAKVSNGVLTFNPSNTQLNNLNNINLLNNNSVYSIGQNTFFGNNKLTSVTLSANGITKTSNQPGLFKTTATNIASNSSLNTSAASYTKDKVSFGNNESLVSLNYTNFTKENASLITDSGASSSQQTLFNTTNSTTWNEVAKIINSLSYQKSPTQDSEATTSLKANVSNWTGATNNSGDPINTDTAASLTGNDTNKKVTITNSFTPASNADTMSAAASSIDIPATIESKTFIHNGITWTYKNDGTNITLTGAANMYKLSTNTTTTNYLVFFNETTYSKTGTPNQIYYVPSSTPVNVTLTIATKATTPTK